jgi:hypothetical protein
MPKLEDISVHAFIQQHGIRNEKGEPIDFYNHRFLFQPYADLSPKQVYLKAAQIGASTMQIIKSLWLAKKFGMNEIYTLPTESDVQDFAGGKVNPIISQNPILQSYVDSKDSVEQKRLGNATIYYRGTFTQKAAIMVSSDINMYDEVDASNQGVIEQYASRQQHSKFKWEHYFSHPSTDGYGVAKIWELSDQKHWFIRCGACEKEQYLSWPQSVNMELQCYQCKFCKSMITDEMRRNGRWVKKFKDREYSGYWISLLMCPWVPASEIIQKFHEKSEEYFYNKVLGLPYVGGGNKLTKALLMRNLTSQMITPEGNERVIIGVDTGKHIHFVCGTDKGLFYYGYGSDYDELDRLMERWPKAIVVVDQGGDLIGSRQLRERYVGRVFLCTFAEDRKTMQLVRWGEHDEDGNVIADRNRCIQLVVSEFTDKRIPLQGNENDWYDYWLHWNALTRITKETERQQIKKEWVRNGPDHWALATTYWRVGMMRFGGDKGGVIQPPTDGGVKNMQESPTIAPDNTIPQTDPKKLFQFEARESNDWRI